MKRLFHSVAKLNRSPCSAKEASKQQRRELFSDQLLARFNEVAITVHQPQRRVLRNQLNSSKRIWPISARHYRWANSWKMVSFSRSKTP
jgi:hypothetical protein